MQDQMALKVLDDLLRYAERQICMHENTHRGGVLWEICDDCGAKWADDEGGKPKFEWPEEIIAARDYLEVAGAPKTSEKAEKLTEFERVILASALVMLDRSEQGHNVNLRNKIRRLLSPK